SEADMAAVRSAMDRVNQVKSGDDPAAIQRALDDLQRASQAMAEHLHAAPAAAGSRAASNGPTASSDGASRGGQADEVIDVEFEEKK
ncbi:MAG: molecular chaperone DnaK, partial [Isosphaeraceae bacterium]